MQHGERSSHPHLFRFHRLLEMDEFSIQSYCATYPTKSIVDAISISIAPVLLAQTPTKLFCYHLKKSARSPKFSTFTHFITALSARKTKDSKIIFGPQDSTKKGGTNYNRKWNSIHPWEDDKRVRDSGWAGLISSGGEPQCNTESCLLWGTEEFDSSLIQAVEREEEWNLNLNLNLMSKQWLVLDWLSLQEEIGKDQAI